MFNTLEVAVDGAIGSLWLNRPQRLNALSVEVLRELAGAARWFDEQDGVRVVLVGGRGRAFCAGADLDAFPAVADAGVRQAADLGRLMAEAIEGMRAVTVARIQGWCVGGGLVLAAACDLRVAGASARFSIPEIDLGVPVHVTRDDHRPEGREDRGGIPDHDLAMIVDRIDATDEVRRIRRIQERLDEVRLSDRRDVKSGIET